MVQCIVKKNQVAKSVPVNINEHYLVREHGWKLNWVSNNIAKISKEHLLLCHILEKTQNFELKFVATFYNDTIMWTNQSFLHNRIKILSLDETSQIRAEL